MKNIVLIGLMGCGKTTIAQLLSKKLNIEYIDMDDYIEKKYDMSISDMFNISEDYFREKESLVCKELFSTCDSIIATGGGVIKNKENLSYFKDNSIIIYIHRPIELIINDINIEKRPLLKEGVNKLYTLYKERHDLYNQSCHYCLNNNGSIDEIINQIISLQEIINEYNL